VNFPPRRHALLVAVTCSLAFSTSSEAAPDPVRVPLVASAPRSRRFGSHLVWAGLAAGAVAVVARNDAWLSHEANDEPSSFNQTLARAAQPLGNGGVVLPALAAFYGASILTGHIDAARSTLRVGASVAVAGGVALALKEAIGRVRPLQEPNDTDDFLPFTGAASMPSGHTTVAFATAAAIDRETSARWVPWLVYPAAALVGWSRVHDHEHWTSDVVAGAAVGAWTGWKTDAWLANRAARRAQVGMQLAPGGAAASVTIRF